MWTMVRGVWAKKLGPERPVQYSARVQYRQGQGVQLEERLLWHSVCAEGPPAQVRSSLAQIRSCWEAPGSGRFQSFHFYRIINLIASKGSETFYQVLE